MHKGPEFFRSSGPLLFRQSYLDLCGSLGERGFGLIDEL
jgi:hypothetical protein